MNKTQKGRSYKRFRQSPFRKKTGGKHGLMKYRNQPVKIAGHNFDSKKEALRFIVLNDMLQKGEIVELQLQPEFNFPMGFKYTGDFAYKKPDGDTLIVEDVKSVTTRKITDYRLRVKCLKYFFPEVDLREVGADD